jgi:hypothetical protein
MQEMHWLRVLSVKLAHTLEHEEPDSKDTLTLVDRQQLLYPHVYGHGSVSIIG